MKCISILSVPYSNTAEVFQTQGNVVFFHFNWSRGTHVTLVDVTSQFLSGCPCGQSSHLIKLANLSPHVWNLPGKSLDQKFGISLCRNKSSYELETLGISCEDSTT